MEKSGTHYHPLKSNPAQWAHGTMSYRQPPGSVEPMTNHPLTRRTARMILHEGRVRGHRLTATPRRFFGARASGYPMRGNPSGGQFYLNARWCPVCRSRPHLEGCPRTRRGRRNPSRRNPGGGTNWLLIGGLAMGAFFLLPKLMGTAGANPLSTFFGGGTATVPPGYTPIGNGLYRAPNGAIVARNPQTGQMVMAPAGSVPTSAEDLLTRAGISLIPSVANNLASWISSMFSTQQTATGAITTPLDPATSDVLFGSPSLPPLAPLPDSGGYSFWGGSSPADESLFGGDEGWPPLTEMPTYPVYDWGTDWGSYEYGDYEVPGLPPIDWDVAIGVGSGEVTIANPDDWWGYMGLGHRGGSRRPFGGVGATPPVY